MWELTVGKGDKMGGRGRRGTVWGNCNRITIKHDLIIRKRIYHGIQTGKEENKSNRGNVNNDKLLEVVTWYSLRNGGI